MVFGDDGYMNSGHSGCGCGCSERVRLKRLEDNLNTVMTLLNLFAEKEGYEMETVQQGEDKVDVKWVRKVSKGRGSVVL